MVSKVPRPREENAIFKRMRTAELLVRGVYRHREPVALIFTSPPGLGKTSLIQRVCAETGQRLLKPRPSPCRADRLHPQAQWAQKHDHPR
jgi:hypothetical protein